MVHSQRTIPVDAEKCVFNGWTSDEILAKKSTSAQPSTHRNDSSTTKSSVHTSSTQLASVQEVPLVNYGLKKFDVPSDLVHVARMFGACFSQVGHSVTCLSSFCAECLERQVSEDRKRLYLVLCARGQPVPRSVYVCQVVL